MNLKVHLKTLEGQNPDGSADTYVLVQQGLMGDWTLRYSKAGSVTKPSLAKLLHTLGGIVAWQRWSPEAQEWLRAHNNGKPLP